MNFIYIALAFASLNLNTSYDIIWVIIIFTLYNNSFKDSFGAIELFPGLLRFDSDRQAIQIYKLTATSFLSIYEKKIKMQRSLGIFESIFLLLLISLIIKPTWEVILFGLSLWLFNFIVTPHLNTMSSFVFPHFNFQHFSETDDFIEDELLVDKIGYRFRQVIILVFIVPVLFLIFFDVSLRIIFLISAINYILITFVSLYIIKVILNKKEQNYVEKSFF